ncbi:leucine-responsive regulatory protein [Lrp] [Thermoplasma volcanium GSS1]|uniref:Leucine-responsive regulatory protein [Lrp] n=2 Tax=Thermoplasma volcanium TaxID=50339 RepID=Q979E1_THEVO|nr:leucine-responsive regulatory protein [Lrp] [Thermoplasma volcanium GSS1]
MLETDCSLTYEEIAKMTGKSLWTIRDRILALKKRGVIKSCRAEIDYDKLGLPCRAIIGFNVPPDKIDDFVEQAKKDKRIKKFIITTGSRRFHIKIIGKQCGEIREYARTILPKFGVFDVDFEVVLDEII